MRHYILLSNSPLSPSFLTTVYILHLPGIQRDPGAQTTTLLFLLLSPVTACPCLSLYLLIMVSGACLKHHVWLRDDLVRGMQVFLLYSATRNSKCHETAVEGIFMDLCLHVAFRWTFRAKGRAHC